jgi:hypothetical protein
MRRLTVPPWRSSAVPGPQFRQKVSSKLGRQLGIQEVMDLFGVNENVTRQTRSARWEAEQEANWGRGPRMSKPRTALSALDRIYRHSGWP